MGDIVFCPGKFFMMVRNTFLLLLTGLTLQAMNQGPAKRPRRAVTCQTPREQESALLEAARVGNLDAVRALLERGTDPNITDDCRRTPLMLAAKKEIASLLLRHKAALDTWDQYGETALIWAVSRHRNLDLVEFLLDWGADPNATNWENVTALMHAAISGPPAMVELLITAGANIQAKAHGGRRVLQWAIDNDNVAVTKLLLAAGADTTGLNLAEEKRTAELYGRPKMLQLLSDYHQKISNQNTDLKG